VAETGPDDTTRYQMLETLRQYALERLDETGVVDEFRRRHATYYARFAEDAGAALVGRDEVAWRPRVAAERDNLRAAVYWAIDRDDDTDATFALRIIAALVYEAIMDPPAGVGAWAERALEPASRSTAPQRMAVFGAAAYEAANLNRYEVVAARAAEALSDGVDADSLAPGIAWFAASMRLNQTGNQSEGVRLGIDAIHILEPVGIDVFGVLMLHCMVSYFAIEAGDLETARAYAESALALARRIENPSALMSALMNLARASERDDPVRALEAFEQAIALGRAGATQLVMGMALVGVARLRARSGDRAAALHALRAALVDSDHVGFRPIVTEVLGPGAEILIRVGRPATAVTLSGSVLDGALAEIMVSSDRNAELERMLAGVREELGPDEYDRAFARGAVMSYEEIVEFVLDDLQLAAPEAGDA
jgi:tetratricopeptide (TPR) repeat protein